MIGVYGGTFDPIHYGHLRPVLDVVEEFEIKKCHFIPCSVPHHRSLPLASPAQRLEMVAAAIKNEPRFFLDPAEINREGISYTVDTLELIQKETVFNDSSQNKILCLIVGIDAFTKFDHWHRWLDILNLCHIIVTHRPGWDSETVIDSNTISLKLRNVISRHRIMDKLELRSSHFGKIIFQSVTQLDISASRIRALLAGNNSIEYLLPVDVINIIKNQNIYVK